jgi:hypothetical protein
MAERAAAAYNVLPDEDYDQKDPKLSNVSFKVTEGEILFYVVLPEEGSLYPPRLYGAIYGRSKEVTASVKGTSMFTDWKINLKCSSTKSGTHTGFEGAAAAYSEAVGYLLKRFCEDINKISLSLTGHSMGGAVVELAALKLAESVPQVEVFKWGAPKTFVEPKPELVPDKVHVTAFKLERDPVTSLPPRYENSRFFPNFTQVDIQTDVMDHSIATYQRSIEGAYNMLACQEEGTIVFRNDWH